jgi:predicted phosphohydrolase
MRLETSLKAAGERDKLCFLHYPPVYKNYVCQEVIDMMQKYQVKKCFYGHIHGIGHRIAAQGMIGGIENRLVSSDYLNFRPLKAAD